MKTKLCIGLISLATTLALAQTTNLTALLQQGLFEEQANRNLNAAITDYQTLALQFDKDRQLAATAVFRLGECYRAEGRTNEAAVQYQRILRDFSDQQTLATLSRQDLAGMGVAASATQAAGMGQVSASPAVESRILETQIAGIQKLQADPEEQAREVLAIFPDDTLKSMLLQLPKLQDQLARLQANPQLTYMGLVGTTGYRTAVGPDRDILSIERHSTNLLADAQSESDKQQQWIQERVKFILGIQKARLKALEAAGVSGNAQVAQSEPASPVTGDEDREIQRVQEMIQDSPDLINAPGDGGTPLVKAAANGWLKVAAFLLQHGADVNASSPLIAAVNAGNKAMTQFLIDHGADINAGPGNGDAPLLVAAEKGFQSVAEVLIASHARVNARNENGQTALILACKHQQGKIVQALLAAGADPELKEHDNSWTALNYATVTSPEPTKILLEARADPNTKDNAGRTPLCYLLSSDVNYQLSWPRPIMTEADRTATLKLLLAAKADPNMGTLNRPLLCAIDNNDINAAGILFRAGANPNLKGMVGWVPQNGFGGSFPRRDANVTPISLAVSGGEISMVQLVLKFKADPNDSQTDGEPVAFAALDKPEIAKALLDAGANPNITRLVDDTRPGFPPGRQSRHVTLLQQAAGMNQAGTIRVLLEAGATNINVCDENGNSPIHDAALALTDEPEFMVLLEHGANPNVRNNDGKTPLDIVKAAAADPNSWFGRFDSGAAKVAQAEKLITLLRNHGALDNPPDWDRITLSRPATDYSRATFRRDAYGWNHFTLLESLYWVQYGNKDGLTFPDLAHIVIARPSANNAVVSRIKVNLLNATNELDVLGDIPLEFGDRVEIPEREHSLAEGQEFLSGKEQRSLQDYLSQVAGEVRLVVAGGQTVQLPLRTFQSDVSQVLSGNSAREALTSSSDLSHVKVTRHDAKTGKVKEVTLDCSSQNRPGLWLRAGDVIEVPLKP